MPRARALIGPTTRPGSPTSRNAATSSRPPPGRPAPSTTDPASRFTPPATSPGDAAWPSAYSVVVVSPARRPSRKREPQSQQLQSSLKDKASAALNTPPARYYSRIWVRREAERPAEVERGGVTRGLTGRAAELGRARCTRRSRRVKTRVLLHTRGRARASPASAAIANKNLTADPSHLQAQTLRVRSIQLF